MLGSEPPPGAGSVMAKDERTFPSTMGFSHFSFCAGVPSFFSTFMLPSSGAMQLKASGPNSERAASSYITAQATIGRSMPPYSFGDCGAQRPAFLAFSRTGVEPRVRDVLVLGEIHPDRIRAAARAPRRRRGCGREGLSISGDSVKSMISP